MQKSTICREFKRSIPKRGRGSGEYSATNAQRITIIRHNTKPKYIIFKEELKKSARHLLIVEKHSPELITAIWEKAETEGVSYETLYKWILRAKFSKH